MNKLIQIGIEKSESSKPTSDKMVRLRKPKLFSGPCN